MEIVLPTGGFVWRGDWNALVAYDEGDVVKRDGDTYRAISETNAGDDPLNGGVWEIFLPKGADGDGIPGAQGPAGPPGPKGDKGDPGNVGPVGPVGPVGAKGDKGDQGAASVVPGPAGAQGPAGPQGAPGADSTVPGPQGVAGPAGVKGDKGDPGAQGPAGADSVVPGPAGPAGAAGPQGIKGDQGDPGPAGAAGPQGAKGDIGNIGPAGPQGPAGADGAQGPQGVQGAAGLNGGLEIASAPIGANYAVTGAWGDVPGGQIVVPANSGPCDVEIYSKLLVNIVTGTNVAATLFQLEAMILDELGAMVDYNKFPLLQVTNVSKNVGGSITLGASIGNNVADKTYRLQMKMGNVGVNGAAANLFTSAGGFVDPLLRAVRR